MMCSIQIDVRKSGKEERGETFQISTLRLFYMYKTHKTIAYPLGLFVLKCNGTQV